MSTSELPPAQWRKSTHSDSEGGACVEIADLRNVIAVRDSKNPDGPKLAFGRAVFGVLAREIRAGRHDL